jgi:inositol-pentakisphosphate 2-kinase
VLIPIVHSLLVHTPVLRTLAILQRSLDVLDIEGLSNLWALSHIQPPSESPALCAPPIGSTSPDPTISEWTNFVDQYLSAHNTLDHAHPETSNLRYYLLAYLLSATFKDCSIMLRINPSDSNASSDAEINSVTLIDLDPKSIDRLTKWEKLDREIVESYNGTEEKHCVDGWMDNMPQRPKTCSQT